MDSKYLIPVVTVLAVIVLAWVVLPQRDPEPVAGSGVSVAGQGSPDLQARLSALEQDLAREREARLELQARYDLALSTLALPAASDNFAQPAERERLSALESEFGLVFTDTGDGAAIVVPAADDASQLTLPASGRLSGRALSRARFEAISEGREREFMAEQLVANGFSAEEADHITKRESELRLEALYDDYEERRQRAEDARNAANAQDTENPGQMAVAVEELSPNEQLRAEIGDENYAKYLEANGRSTTVNVRSVMESSPAQMSGLLPGDEIISYNGERVFSISEINDRTIEGLVGESVLLDVERNGEQVQVTIPRGPLGISTGRGR